MKSIDIGRDFSRFPSGRYEKNGSTSGEAFRNKLLKPTLSENETIEIFFDNAIGYGSSFLEEAFGGLIRNSTLKAEDFKKKFSLISSDESLKIEILDYVARASAK